MCKSSRLLRAVDLSFLALVSFVPMALFVFLFSAIGRGDDIYLFLEGFGDFAPLSFCLASLIILVGYLLDWSYWEERIWIKVRYVMKAVVIVAIVLGTVMSARHHPTAPVALFLLGVPFVFWGVRHKFPYYRRKSLKSFFNDLALVLFTSSIAMLVYFFIWVLSYDNYWNSELRQEYASLLECDEEYCQSAYLYWVCPAVYAGMGLCFGALCSYLGITSDGDAVLMGISSGKTMDDKMSGVRLSTEDFIDSPDHVRIVSMMPQESKKNLALVIRIFFTLVGLSLLSMWAAASIAGGRLEIANIVTTFAGLSLIVTGMVLVASMGGFENTRAQLSKIPAVQSIMSSFLSDWMRALFVLTSTPIYLGYLLICVLNQRIRVATKSFGKNLEAGEEKLLLTKASHDLVMSQLSWNWSSIIVKMSWLGTFFVVVNVGIARVTTIFLSWLNIVLQDSSLGVTTIIFIAVGICMFLLPPVPGVPVYVAGGIIVSGIAEATFGSYTLALIYTVLICYIIKLIAIVMQQKGIGQNMADSVTVRKLVGVNSVTTRSIRKILQEPGLKANKVMILCGGPDWPTSVLTGILRLSVVKMLIGSLPVIFLVTPCVLAGAFLLKADESDTWSTLGSVALSIAAMSQTAALVAATYYIQKATVFYDSELANEDLDQEVLALEEKEAAKERQYKALSNWAVVSTPMRCTLVSSAILIIISSYLLQFFTDDCFKDFSLTDTIGGKLDGSVFNVVKTTGWVALGMWLYSFIVNYIFKHWVNVAIKKQSPGKTP